MRITKSRLTAGITLLAYTLAFAPPVWAEHETAPSAGAMFADVVVARPAGVVITALGTAAFLVSLPFSLLGGNVDQAANKLVVGPARETFVRCLGCARHTHNPRTDDSNR